MRVGGEIVALGNALLDVVAEADEAFLEQHGLEKGSMTMADEARTEALHGAVSVVEETPGGAVANTLYAMARLGGKPVFLCKVREDEAGLRFVGDLESAGVRCPVAAAVGGAASGRCIVLVTPDAERSMSTYLGASALLGEGDIDLDIISGAGLCYMEAYLWDSESARGAVLKAARGAREGGVGVGLNLSDPLCVGRHRGSLLSFVGDYVSLLIGNESEIVAFHGVGDFSEALERTRAMGLEAVLTRSELGAVVVGGGEVHEIGAHAVPSVVDETGAGDAFAAGYLHSRLGGLSLREAGEAGAREAARVLGHFGARARARK